MLRVFSCALLVSILLPQAGFANCFDLTVDYYYASSDRIKTGRGGYLTWSDPIPKMYRNEIATYTRDVTASGSYYSGSYYEFYMMTNDWPTDNYVIMLPQSEPCPYVEYSNSYPYGYATVNGVCESSNFQCYTEITAGVLDQECYYHIAKTWYDCATRDWTGGSGEEETPDDVTLNQLLIKSNNAANVSTTVIEWRLDPQSEYTTSELITRLFRS